MENGTQIKELIKDIAVLKADRQTTGQVHERLDNAITKLIDFMPAEISVSLVIALSSLSWT